MDGNDKSPDKQIEERVHQQLIYKDNRIIDLNNVILDKERQILDLQERVREQGEVATVKTQAMRIVQQKFEELNRERRDMATETESSLLNNSDSHQSTSSAPSKPDRRTRSSSPGHIIASRKGVTSGTFSPPPIDPPVDKTSKFGAGLADIDGINHKKNRKKVTFDIPGARLSTDRATDELASALDEASSENAHLHQQIEELNATVEKMKEEYEAEVQKYTSQAKTAGLKARVVATARIKELEASLETMNNKYADETERLQEKVNTLANSRDWELTENGKWREQVAHLKEKVYKLTEELDASEKSKRTLDEENEEAKKIMELMVDDLSQAENIINYHENQKIAIFEDVDRLKDAITAQDRFIDILEADIVIYEQHIGLLRESLGASKIDHRALIKSKAFETKLLALEKEKDQIDKKSNEDRLKTKALDKKCRVLVEQNEQLMAKLCELEMNTTGNDSYHQQISALEEQVKQLSCALENERDVGQSLRESRDAFEKELAARADQQRLSREESHQRTEAEQRTLLLSKELETTQQQLEDALVEVEELRAANFDLQANVEQAKKLSRNLASSNSELSDKLKSVKETMEEKDEELKQSTWDCEQLSKQNESMRVELESSKNGLKEAAVVKNEIRMLKEEMDRTQEMKKKEYEEACRMLSEEPVATRKSSLEVQHEQYIIAFEQKVEKLNKELEESRAKIEKDKTEKNKLKLAVKQLKEKLESREVVVETPIQKEEAVQLQSSNFSQNMDEVQSIIQQKDYEIMELKKTIESLQLEANLSGELNIEMGRAMIELEERNAMLDEARTKNQNVKQSGNMELRLHEMLVDEMSTQMEEMQTKLEDLEKAKLESEKSILELASSRHEIDTMKSEITRLLRNLAESEIARRDEIENITSAHHDEIRNLSISMEDSRREISELEEKLNNSIESYNHLQTSVELERCQNVMVSSQQHITPPVVSIPIQETVILQSSSPTVQSATVPPLNLSNDQLIEENNVLRECFNEAKNVHEDVTRDMSKLLVLKDELEIAVSALKGEIWTLNGQLKESILDRERLEDRVVELDCAVEKEKKRAITLDVELQEQVDLTERAVRRAAEAENESNVRLAECLEKEERREEIEKAYTSLNEYYNQLQSAYNGVYAQLAERESQKSQQQLVSNEPSTSQTSLLSSDAILMDGIIDGIMNALQVIQASAISLSTQQKLEAVLERVKTIMMESAETKTALEEQRKITDALQRRLEVAEENAGSDLRTKERLEELEGEIEWKEEECEGLKRRIRELEKALDSIAERANESEATTVSRLSTDLAILAAKLTTRQADVDSLFRTNAELAHTNVRLQNEIDEIEEKDLVDKSSFEQEKVELERQVAQLEKKVQELEHQLAQQSEDDHDELKRKIDEFEVAEIELKEQVADLELKLSEMATTSSQNKQSDANWGWDEEEQGKQQLSNEELVEAKGEVVRLSGIEKILNNRIMALEDVNMELEEKLQNMEEELYEQKEKQKNVVVAEVQSNEEVNKEADWGWGEESSGDDAKKLTEAMEEVERLKAIETDLTKVIQVHEKQLSDMKQLVQSAEDALVAEQEKCDELEIQLANQNNKPNAVSEESWGWGEEETTKTSSDLEEQLKNTEQLIESQTKLIKNLNSTIQKLEAEIDEMHQEKTEYIETEAELRAEIKTLTLRLKTMEESEKVAKEEIERLQSIPAAKEDEGWNDNGWGEEENNEKDEEINRLKHSEMVLEQKVAGLEEKLEELLHAKEEASALESRIAELMMSREDDEALLKRLEMSEEFNDDLTAKLEEATDLLKGLTEELNAKNEEIQRLIGERDKLEKELDSKATEGWNDDGWGEEEEKNNGNEEEMEMLKCRENELMEKVSNLENTIQQLQKLEIEYDSLKEKYADAVRENEEGVTSMNERNEEERNELSAKLEEQNMLIEQLNEQITSQKKEIDVLKSEKNDLEKKIAEKDENSGWNDDGWGEEKEENDDWEEMKRQLMKEVEDRDKLVAELGLELSAVQDELLKINSATDVQSLQQQLSDTSSELESVRKELRHVLDQNGLLKDSEARLIDHADEFAEQTEKYKTKCIEMSSKIKDLEAKIEQYSVMNDKRERSSDELVTIRQQLSNLENEVRTKSEIISDREGLISQLQSQLNSHSQTIDELTEKLKVAEKKYRAVEMQRRKQMATASNPSRPSSQMSSSSKVSVVSNRVRQDSSASEQSIPIQSARSAFEVVIPQASEPIRRRNK